MLDDLDRGIRCHGGHERAFDLGAGGVTAGVSDPAPHVAALAGQLQLPGKITIELRTSVDQLGYLIWALGDEHAHGFEP